jgi:hypothetical protein
LAQIEDQFVFLLKRAAHPKRIESAVHQDKNLLQWFIQLNIRKQDGSWPIWQTWPIRL